MDADRTSTPRLPTPTGSDLPMTTDFSPAFLVGITGHMDLGPEETQRLRAQLHALFRYLKHGGVDRDHQNILPDWPGLPHTPIVVLSSLAPGADALAAEVALELHEEGFSVVAPLPFPPNAYRGASTFVRNPQPPGHPDPADAQRQADFDDLVKRGDEHFTVLLQEDLDVEEAQLEQRFQHDLRDRDRRHRRYRAAGEYIAASAHLLIAIWDGKADAHTCGTAAIVDARLRGLTSGLLPSMSALPQGDYGPIIHLPTSRSDARAPVRQPCVIDSSGEAGVVSARSATALLRRIAANLDVFNSVDLPRCTSVDQELDKRLSYRDAAGVTQSFATSLRSRSSLFHTGLRNLAGLRRRAAAANEVRDPRNRGVWRRLFLLSFVAALLVHLFAHWHTAHAPDHAAATTATTAPPADVPEVEAAADAEQDHHGSGLRGSFGIAALLVALTGLAYFWVQAPRGDAERAHDYRAIAEGLRVQFYWCLLGLGKSVPASYMLRQRTELNWIRGAIRSVASPYVHWRAWFSKLERADQVVALRCALHGWVADQAEFFHRSARERHEELHFWHKLGAVFGFAALWSMVGLSLDAIVCGCVTLEHHAWTALLLLAVVAGWMLLTARSLSAGLIAAPPPNTHSRKEPRNLRERVIRRTRALLGFFAATEDPHAAAWEPRQRRWLMLRNAGRLQPLAIATAALGLLVCALVCALFPALPGPFDLAIVVSGSLLVAGAASVAWSEKNLLSEHAYQYHSMAALFHGARSRVERYVDRAAAAQNDPAEFARTLEECRAFLFELGREALAENAEWLILHRARPLEPVIPG